MTLATHACQRLGRHTTTPRPLRFDPRGFGCSPSAFASLPDLPASAHPAPASGAPRPDQQPAIGVRHPERRRSPARRKGGTQSPARLLLVSFPCNFPGVAATEFHNGSDCRHQAIKRKDLVLSVSDPHVASGRTWSGRNWAGRLLLIGVAIAASSLGGCAVRVNGYAPVVDIDVTPYYAPMPTPPVIVIPSARVYGGGYGGWHRRS